MTNVPDWQTKLPVNKTNWNQIAKAANTTNAANGHSFRTPNATDRPRSISIMGRVNAGFCNVGQGVYITGIWSQQKERQAFLTEPVVSIQQGRAMADYSTGVVSQKTGHRIREVVVAGVTHAIVQINAVDDSVARLGSDGATLESYPTGMGMPILATHYQNQTGLQWCLVNVGNYISARASRYECRLTSAINRNTTSVLVDNLVPLNGTYNYVINYPETEFTVYNTLKFVGNNNAKSIIEWSQQRERFEFISVECPA